MISDNRLNELRQWSQGEISLLKHFTSFTVGELLDEVDRLRAENEKVWQMNEDLLGAHCQGCSVHNICPGVEL